MSVARALLATAIAAVAVAGCARPSERIATALVRYGLDQQRADCIGEDLERRLSVGQLLELKRAADAYARDDADPGRLRPSDLIRVAGELRDPAVPIAVGRAGLRCGLGPFG